MTSPISKFAIFKDREASDSSELLTIIPPTTQWHNITIILIFAADIISNPITYTIPRKWWKIPLSIHHENTSNHHEFLNIRLTIQNLKYEYHFRNRFGPDDIKMRGSKHTVKTSFKFWNIKVETCRGHTLAAMLQEDFHNQRGNFENITGNYTTI
jgi:hypothetical protein